MIEFLPDWNTRFLEGGTIVQYTSIDEIPKLGREQVSEEYQEATRNFSSEQRGSLESDPRDHPGDSDHTKYAKALYRHLARFSGGSYEADGVAIHA